MIQSLHSQDRANRKVLFISYIFPPRAGGGAYRTAQFVKYLPKSGWDPVVLTVSNDRFHWATDESLLTLIPEEVEVVRTPVVDPLYLLPILSRIGAANLVKVFPPGVRRSSLDAQKAHSGGIE